MAIAYNASIVTDGLVLYIDAANSKCMDVGSSSGVDLVSKKILNGLSQAGVSVTNYTPASSSFTSKAVKFTSGGTSFPYLDHGGILDFRNSITWISIACKEIDTGRQSIWGNIGDASPWDGTGLVSYSHDGNGQLSWWSGTNYGGWWDTGLVLPTNKWVFAAGTWSGNTQTVWTKWDSVNFQTTSRSISTFTNPIVASKFTLGDNNTDGDNGTGTAANIIDGAIPVCMIYNRALSEAEIQQNFNALRGRYGI